MVRSGRPRLPLTDRVEWYGGVGERRRRLFQFLWPKPGKGTADGLLCMECEDDDLAFNEARKNIADDGSVKGAPFTLMKLYVKKISEFEA
ncbi:hypothetical protein LINPERPRIM_LOCUS20074 [Linum perenne]